MKWGVNDHKREDNYTLRKSYICEDNFWRSPRSSDPLGVTVSSLCLNSPWTWGNGCWSGTWLSAPASGYFSSNLPPNATITLIYGSSHPFNSPVSKSAHLQKQGPERKSWLCSTDGLIDSGTTFFCSFTCQTNQKLRAKQITWLIKLNDSWAKD